MPTLEQRTTTTTAQNLTTNDTILDRSIRHAVFFQRFTAGEVRDAVAFLNSQVIPDIDRKIEMRLARIRSRGFDPGPFTTKRFRFMIQRMREGVRNGMRALGRRVTGRMGDYAKVEANFVQRMLAVVTPGELGFDFSAPSPGQLRSIVTSRPFQGRLLREWFSGLAASTQDQISSQLKIGLAEGETVPQLMRRLRGTGGVWTRTTRGATAVVRTAANHVHSQAREMTYQENDDLIKGVQWISTLDARTTDICASLDGRVFKVGEGERPPIHINCRSTTIPITKSFRELGIPARNLQPVTRASMNGQVPATLKYPQWLKRQPKAVQDEVLGKGRARLFRQGVDVYKFKADGITPLSLEELRATLE